MGWKTYAVAMLLFNAAGMLFVYTAPASAGRTALQPQGFGAVSADSSFNTAASFATNTNWRGYGGESTMSYLTQMLGLTVQNFVSAATGMATVVAPHPRSSRGRTAQTIGNFWVDLTRTTLYILLPAARSFSPSRSSPRAWSRPLAPTPRRAVVQPTEYDEPITDKDGKPVLDEKGQPKTKKATLTGAGDRGGTCGLADRHQAARHQRGRLLQRQLRPPLREPDAALESPRSAGHPAHPGRALLHVRRHGPRHAAGLGPPGRHDRDLRGDAEHRRHRGAEGMGLREAGRGPHGQRAPGGGNMEGKEVRFGIASSALWATATTAASNGSSELDARLVHPDRRARADVDDTARRGGVRRRRLGPVRHGRLRHRGRLPWPASWWAGPRSISARRSRPTR